MTLVLCSSIEILLRPVNHHFLLSNDTSCYLLQVIKVGELSVQ
uniref:Uncharacterized protein n=1 Tax=Triticum urartu TaxID=4572 RepID=A0A8R7Q2E8_TRIUA